jgi:hypothetical protein
MNIPSKIHAKLTAVILENNSSNNAIWGQIFGDIANQTDIMALLRAGQKAYKIDKIALPSKPAIGNTYTFGLDKIQKGSEDSVKAGDLVYGVVINSSVDYAIFASITAVTDTDATVRIENSISQIEYVHDAGYVHTDNNYTAVEKAKLSGIEAGAQVNVPSDWNATSGDAKILNKPTIGDGTITIRKNSSTVGTFKVNQTDSKDIDIVLSKSDVGLNNVDNTKDQDKSISTATQAQLDAVNDSINGIKELIPLATTTANPLVNESQLSGIVGDGTITFQVNGVKVDSITANQSIDSTINLPMNKTALGLGNVDNTSDANKPISSAQQAEFNALYDGLTALGNGKADKSNTYTEAQVDSLLEAKSEKADTYTKSEADAFLVEKADKTSTYTKDEIDSESAGKANRFKISLATQNFNLLEAKLFTVTDSDMLIVYQGATVVFDYDDWCEYSYYDAALDVSYLTLLEWEQQADMDTYILTLYDRARGDIQLIRYVESTDSYTLIYGDTAIDLLHPLGIRTGGSISGNLANYIQGSAASQALLNMDLTNLYQYVKAIGYSSDDSFNDVYAEIDEHTNQLASMYTNAEIDGKDASVKSYADTTFQPLSERDTSIPAEPAENHYPETRAIKAYVDSLIENTTQYRGIIQWCANSGLSDGDACPSGAIEGDRVFDISNNSYFLVDAAGLLAIQSGPDTGNGYFYDVVNFVWNGNQSGVIKYSTVSNAWEYTISNNSGADNSTIEVNGSNNYQVKDGGITTAKLADESITSSKVDATLLSELTNVQSDWEQEDIAEPDYIKNKPSIPGIPGVATTSTNGLMSYADKVKLNTLLAQVITVLPDYAKKETVNRITANNGTWTATKTGYAVCRAVSTQAAVAGAGAVTQGDIAILVNNVVVEATGGHSVVATSSGYGVYRSATVAVAKGDTVKISLSGTNIILSEISCYYIPPKFIHFDYNGNEIN